MGYSPATSIASRSISTLTMYWCSGSRCPRLLFNMATLLTSACIPGQKIPVMSERGCEPSLRESRSLLRACAGGDLFFVPPVGTAILVPPVHGTVDVVLHVPKIAVPIDAIVPPYPGTPARRPPTLDGRPRPASTA